MMAPMKDHFMVILVFCIAILVLAPPSSGVATSSDSLTITGYILPHTTPVANFTANQTTGYAPLSVRFTDLSAGNPTEWEWDFENDGIIDDTIPNPVHTYAMPGTYSVSLTVRNTEGSDTEIKLNYIHVQEPDPAVRIEALKGYIQELPIPRWAQWFLIAPLDRALNQLEKGHSRPAINQMNVFINFVDLLKRFGTISPGQAAYMRGEARAIIDLIEG